MQFGNPLEDFLRSLGLEIGLGQAQSEIPQGYNMDDLIDDCSYRIKLLREIGSAKFGYAFEEIVSQLLISQFRFCLLRNVSILNEGPGGDYDMLAFQSPYLHYIECKATDKIDFKNILKRHQFLHPTMTLILIHLKKTDVESIIRTEVEHVLSDPQFMIERGYALPHQIERIAQRPLVYRVRGNIFISSDEDLRKAITIALRYLHQYVLQPIMRV
jgi:hypothetical protein